MLQVFWKLFLQPTGASITDPTLINVYFPGIRPQWGYNTAQGKKRLQVFLISQVSQGLTATLGTDWKLHCACRPQSSGHVERMNRTLKETLTKLALDIDTDWEGLLPVTVFEVRNTPIKWV